MNEPRQVPPLLVPPLLPPPVLDNSPAQPPAFTEAWGLWATLGLGFAIITAMIIAQSVVVILFVVAMISSGHKPDQSLSHNGLMLFLAIIFSAPVTIGFCWLFAKLKAKQRAWEYLGFKRAGWRHYLWGLGWLAGLALASRGMDNLFNIDEVPSFSIETYRTAGIYPVLWFAVVIAAPVMEEMLFRGFFFKGFSGRGPEPWERC